MGHKYLAYAEERSEVIAGGPFVFGGGFYGSRFGYFGGLPTEVIRRGCETTFDVADGRVLTWALRGNACS